MAAWLAEAKKANGKDAATRQRFEAIKAFSQVGDRRALSGPNDESPWFVPCGSDRRRVPPWARDLDVLPACVFATNFGVMPKLSGCGRRSLHGQPCTIMVRTSDSHHPVETTALWNHLSTAIAYVDGESRLRAPNAALCELVGLGARRLDGESLAQLAPGRTELIDAVRRCAAEQRIVQLRAFPLAPVLGEPVVVDLAFSPLPDGGVLLEAHALPPAPPESTVRLSESLRGFAHEVKNPLAGLRGAAQLLGRRVAEPELRELADLIIAEADRLAALANRLLQGSGKPHLTVVNIHEVLERVAALLAAQEHAPQLTRDFDPSLPPLRGDADRLTQLLLNLGSNAIEAGADRVVLRSRAEHGARIGERVARLALRVDVLDNGGGVPPALADTLFLPMVSGRADGNGLGLAVCREIAREHGGSLTCRSRPGETVFTLLLPLGDPHG
jgi:two-component system nitrogen regulation sensor histidine kinase GlnL